MSPDISIKLGSEVFSACLLRNVAPRSCAVLVELLPYRGKLIHARWSGEACWSPLQEIWLHRPSLPPEMAVSDVEPGKILLFAGDESEPELFIPYGQSRFASSRGALAGNPVLKISDGLARLADLGRKILWGGAMDIQIDHADGKV